MAERTRPQVKQENDETKNVPGGIQTPPSSGSRRSARIASTSTSSTAIKEYPNTRAESSPGPKKTAVKRRKIKEEEGDQILSETAGSKDEKIKQGPTRSAAAAADLQSRKLKSYTQTLNESPFPTFPQPTPSSCHLALSILSSLHGARTRPAAALTKAPSKSAGCGNSPSVLDALIRTILSQNTSDGNSTRAKLSMDAVYGSSDDWAAIAAGGQDKLESAIRCGGLSRVKSKVILTILQQVHDKYDGQYSLDHLHTASTPDAHTELLSFQGVGPKTASCVLLFCLGRESFAVDTHVWRIAGILGWRPPAASREATQAHLEVRTPDECKYGLHVLMVTHGKKCGECRAGGKKAGNCELRKVFAGKSKNTGELNGEKGSAKLGDGQKREKDEDEDEKGSEMIKREEEEGKDGDKKGREMIKREEEEEDGR